MNYAFVFRDEKRLTIGVEATQMSDGNLDNQELVLLLVAIAARTVTQKIKIQSMDPLQVIPNLGGPLKLSDVGIADDDRARIFKDALLTLSPDPAKADVAKLVIAPSDKFANLRSTLEVIIFADMPGDAGGANE